jgi:hypothetical protein
MNVSLSPPIESLHETLSWLSVLTSIRANLRQQVKRVSQIYNVCEFDLTLRVLLHLPRYMYRELEDSDLVFRETARLAAIMRDLQQEYAGWRDQQPILEFHKPSAQVTEVRQDLANVIHKRFHYLGSARTGRHFMLSFGTQEVPAALITLSPMDVHRLKSYISAEQVGRSLLLSRVFSFRWAPRNTISFLLGHIARLLKREGQVKSLLTWVNPNLEFCASSYRASNWTLAGREQTFYRYTEGNYLTARENFQQGPRTPDKLETSKLRLEPLQVWRYDITA